jgi:hypothetical protein
VIISFVGDSDVPDDDLACIFFAEGFGKSCLVPAESDSGSSMYAASEKLSVIGVNSGRNVDCYYIGICFGICGTKQGSSVFAKYSLQSDTENSVNEHVGIRELIVCVYYAEDTAEFLVLG